MNALREQFLSALKSSDKIDVAKSALMAVKNRAGNVVGFGTAEPVSFAEAQRIVDLADPNKVFEGSAAFPFDDSPARETVRKSVPDPNDPNACLTTVFPFQDVSKSATPTGTELMNRVTGHNSEKKEHDRPGRPATAAKKTPLSRFDPKNPSTVLEVSGDKLVAGSVLAVVMPDKSTRYLVLMADTPFDEIPIQ